METTTDILLTSQPTEVKCIIIDTNTSIEPSICQAYISWVNIQIPWKVTCSVRISRMYLPGSCDGKALEYVLLNR